MNSTIETFNNHYQENPIAAAEFVAQVLCQKISPNGFDCSEGFNSYYSYVPETPLEAVNLGMNIYFDCLVSRNDVPFTNLTQNQIQAEIDSMYSEFGFSESYNPFGDYEIPCLDDN